MDFIAKYWIEVLFGLLISIISIGFKKISKKLKEQDNVKLGIQALLRDRIIQNYNKYVELEYCPIYALDNIDAMYKQYHALGGNGTVTKLVEELKEMPTRKDYHEK